MTSGFLSQDRWFEAALKGLFLSFGFGRKFMIIMKLIILELEHEFKKI